MCCLSVYKMPPCGADGQPDSMSRAVCLQNGSKELVKLWGEDALLSWPGALGPVIHERDLHMANTIWAAATGRPAHPPYMLCCCMVLLTGC